MITLLKGKILDIQMDHAVLEVNDIGYKLFMSSRDLSSLLLKEEVIVYTEMIVREDDIKLYAFLTKDERRVFNALRGVSGVGTKTAISMFSIYSSQEITAIIANEELALLTRVSGIGKKTAGRIIIELKDKFAKESDGLNQLQIQSTTPNNNQKQEELAIALENLGYSMRDIKQVISKIDSDLEIEEMIRQALNTLNGAR